MKKLHLATILFLLSAFLLFHVVFHRPIRDSGAHIRCDEMEADASLKSILLVPLDSRPPCREFVVNGGRIIGRTIVTPPTEYMDYYSKAGGIMEMRQWLAEMRAGADAVILLGRSAALGRAFSGAQGCFSCRYRHLPHICGTLCSSAPKCAPAHVLHSAACDSAEGRDRGLA